MTGLIKGFQPYTPHWKNHGTGGGTSFTLDVSSTTNATLVIVGGAVQEAGTDYTVSGTTVTMASSVSGGTEVISAVLYDLGSVTTPAAGSVNFDALAFTSQAQGDILYRAGSSWARLAAGTSGHFLKTQGTGANPTWAAAGGGSLTFLNSTDISSAATFNFTAVDASAYDSYRMVLQSVTPATDAVDVQFRTSTDGGSSYDSGGSDYEWRCYRLGPGAGADGSAGDSSIDLIGDLGSSDGQIGSAAGEDGLNGWIDVIAPHLTNQTTIQWYLSFETPGGELNMAIGAAKRLSSADVDAWRLLFSSGNIESGTITTYGLKNA